MNFLGSKNRLDDDDFTRVDDSYEGGDDHVEKARKARQKFSNRKDSFIDKASDDEASEHSAIDGEGVEMS